jgi:hypothetical protein
MSENCIKVLRYRVILKQIHILNIFVNINLKSFAQVLNRVLRRNVYFRYKLNQLKQTFFVDSCCNEN